VPDSNPPRRRLNKAVKKKRFSGFLDEPNLNWLKERADEDDRSIASMMNLILRRLKQQSEDQPDVYRP
jgi:hypothetical protein